MTKIATLLATTCVLIAGASAASILARASVPAAGTEGVAPIDRPVANRDGKADKLAVLAAVDDSTQAPEQSAAADEPPAADDTAIGSSGPSGRVQLAYAADDAATLPAEAMPEAGARSGSSVTKLPPVIATPAQKPKTAAKPAPKPAALLSDGQIAQIKTRLNLSSSQEYYWPSVEQALRAIGRKINATQRVADNRAPPIDPDSAEVQQLKYAAMPLLFQLREDQKHEVRKLARAMGLDAVAAQI